MEKKINIKLPTEEEFQEMHRKYLEDVENDKNCLTYWYPKVKNFLFIKTPKTRWHYLHPDDGLKLAETRSLDKATVEKLEAWAHETFGKFGAPLFMKTGNFSGKHGWRHTCFLQNPEDFMVHLANMIEQQHCYGCLGSQYVVLREFIPTESFFTAFQGMPVTKEFRLFGKEGLVTHIQPYWPSKAIENPSIENWEPLLKLNNSITEDELTYLKAAVSGLSMVFKGEEWSYDFLKGMDGEWYLIDMAEGHKSYRYQPEEAYV